MIQFSRREDYAVILINTLARNYNRRLTPLSEVARKYTLSILFLRNLANDLRKRGIVRAVEGKKGGYALTKDPKSIQLKEVLQALSKKKLFSCCQNTPDGKCRRNTCPHGFSLRRLNNEFLERIGKLRVSKVASYASYTKP